MTYTLSWECVQPFKTNPTKHQTSMDDIFWAKSGQLVKDPSSHICHFTYKFVQKVKAEESSLQRIGKTNI